MALQYWIDQNIVFYGYFDEKWPYHSWMDFVFDLLKLKPKRWRTEIAVAAILLSEIPQKITTPPSIDNLGVATPFEILFKSVYRFNLVIGYLPFCNSKMCLVHPHYEVWRKKGQELKIWVISKRLVKLCHFSNHPVPFLKDLTNFQHESDIGT